VHPAWFCNEYAAQTMFCQSPAHPTEDKSEHFLFPKKPEFQNLAPKTPNWQPCYTRIENAHNVRKKTSNFLFIGGDRVELLQG